MAPDQTISIKMSWEWFLVQWNSADTDSLGNICFAVQTLIGPPLIRCPVQTLFSAAGWKTPQTGVCVRAHWIYLKTWHREIPLGLHQCDLWPLCLIPAGLLAPSGLRRTSCRHPSAPLQLELCDRVPAYSQHPLFCRYKQPSGMRPSKFSLSWSDCDNLIPDWFNFKRSSLACHVQELLDEEKAEMEVNQMKERGTRTFNFGAYHHLETVGSLQKNRNRSWHPALILWSVTKLLIDDKTILTLAWVKQTGQYQERQKGQECINSAP